MNIFDKIGDFNEFYGLPNPGIPTLSAVGDPVKRVLGFTKTLRDELDEGLDIINKLNAGAGEVEVLTDLADWFNDIVVYSLSEAAKFGIPSAKVLEAIMESNFSKREEDGTVLKDEFGKVLKGSLFYPPEPEIRRILMDEMGLEAAEDAAEESVEDAPVPE